MKMTEFKLKQACAILGVSAKDLQNLVQFDIVRPARRDGVCWFDYRALLEAKVAFFLKDALGSSSVLLARFTQALSGQIAQNQIKGRQQNILLRSRPNSGQAPVDIDVPLRSLAEELDRRLPLAAASKDLPKGRRRPGWKQEFLSAALKASDDLAAISEQQILKTIREYRANRKKLPEITIVARAKKKTA
jgi:hypothetical protein